MEPQQSDAESHDTQQLTMKSEPQEVEFDSEMFASLLQNQLIAYNFSWDPLMKALETLAASMGRQQRHQKGNNDAMDEMRDQFNQMKDRLDQAEQSKQEMAIAVEKLQQQVGVLHAELANTKQEQDTQRQEMERLKSDLAAPAVHERDQAPQVLPGAFATTNDLQHVKQSLTNQLRKSLSAVFGEQFVVNDGEEEADDELPVTGSVIEPSVAETQLAGDWTSGAVASSDGGSPAVTGSVNTTAIDSTSRPPSRPTTGVSGVLRTPLPGVPFASEAMVRFELAKLRDHQAELEAKQSFQKQEMKALHDKVGGLDTRLDEAAAAAAMQQQQQRRNSVPPVDGTDGKMPGPSTDILQKQIAELQDQQNALLQQLKDQAQAVDKQASGIKELVATLDDLAMQQAMYRASPPDSSRSDDGKKPSSDSVGPAHLDLSLVFTKIADLRRATDASVDQIQQSVKQAAATTASQQTQLDALRNAAVFNDLQKVQLLETRLALQKELLDRNQTHQDRTKPQLAEWKKNVEQTEDKLLQGQCDQEVMDEIHQLQRNYHRTMLTMSPLINSPLTIAESLQKLAEEVKSLQGGVQAGIIPLSLENNPTAGESGSTTSKYQRVEEFATKLRYLDEEVEATNQVNVVTEKKNDPLLKSLDTMRDKLERMWSLWHQNLVKKKAGDGSGMGVMASTTTPRVGTESPATGGSMVSIEGFKDVEMRLMGAVRRINSLEEDVDRLGALVGNGSSSGRSTTGAESQLRTKADASELVKLRKEMQDEIQRLAGALAGLQASTATLVPSAPPGGRTSPGRGDLVGDLHSQMVKRGGRDGDGRYVHEGSENGDDGYGQRTMYDALLKDLTKKVTQSVLQQADKSNGNAIRTTNGPAGVNANPNVNFRALLENFTHKFDDKLEDTHEFTVEELAKLRKELLDLLKTRLEAALRELRAEFQLVYYSPAGEGNSTGDSTAVGTKPVMCVACSRPVPVSGMVRDAGAYPSAEMIAEQTNGLLHAELEYDRNDDEFVYRAGFKMPADRKTMMLPFLANNIRNRIALNKIDRKPRRPARHNGNAVDNVVREAMDLDRKQRYSHGGHNGHPPSPPK